MPRRDRIEAGIAYVPEDRRHVEGLVMDYDPVRNGLLGNQTIEPFAKRGFIDWDAVRDHTEAIIEEFDVQPPNPDTEAESLSGGNQQKFIVGREIGHEPDVLVASHPTRGVDIGSIEFIHNRLTDLRDEGWPLSSSPRSLRRYRSYRTGLRSCTRESSLTRWIRTR